VEKIKKVEQISEEKKIGSYLLLVNGIILIFLGISSILGFSIPSVNLEGQLWNSLNGWLIYAIDNIPDLIIGIFTNYKWQYLVDFINITLLITVTTLFIIGGIISFSQKNIYGFLGAILYGSTILLVILTPLTANYILGVPFLSEPKTILHIIDTNIIITIILGFIGGYFTYFGMND